MTCILDMSTSSWLYLHLMHRSLQSWQDGSLALAPRSQSRESVDKGDVEPPAAFWFPFHRKWRKDTNGHTSSQIAYFASRSSAETTLSTRSTARHYTCFDNSKNKDDVLKFSNYGNHAPGKTVETACPVSYDWVQFHRRLYHVTETTQSVTTSNYTCFCSKYYY